ncbi:hypothetical protein JCGZ_22096 [Jatropha curcas]|uniref:Uncharacterized protein n=1 Tax=Jatropha curcas TaxID=180498 RepID=A0A067K3Y8_JATCU|nr:hypothetical protein JCGZ_22096 [Jatropha curcas]
MRPNPSPSEGEDLKMAQIAEVMKKKAGSDRSDKGAPLVIIDPPADNAGVVSEPANVELPPTSPSTELSKKRLRELSVPAPPPLPS